MTMITPARPGVANLQPSLIRKLANSAMGRDDILPLWFGEPDQPTPQFIREAAKDAIDEGQTFYQANAGLPALRQAIARYNNDLFGASLAMENIIVTGSGLAALDVAFEVAVSAGDDIVVLSPIWPNLPSIPAILDANLIRVSLRPKDGYWSLDLDELFDAVTDKTTAMIINSPNNPTGWMLSDEEQQRIVDFCRERDLWLIADEVYSRIVYDRPFAPSFANKVTDDDKFFIVNSFSKAWAMTGWRIGWLVAPRSLQSSLEMLVEFNFSCVFAPTQMAAIVALQEGENFIKSATRRYKAGLDLLIEAFATLPRVTFPLPRAAFYAFFAVDGMTDSYAFAEELLNKAGVGLAPGAAFGPEGEGYLRLCYAAEVDLLQKAIDKMRPLLR